MNMKYTQTTEYVVLLEKFSTVSRKISCPISSILNIKLKHGRNFKFKNQFSSKHCGYINFAYANIYLTACYYIRSCICLFTIRKS